MFDDKTPVIIKGYCGYIVSVVITSSVYATLFNITLRDLRDPRITIVMEDIRHDEITQNPLP